MRLLRILTIAVLLMSTTLLAACNTFRGIGRDLQKCGQAVQKAAE